MFHVLGFPFMLEQLVFLAFLTESGLTLSGFSCLLLRRQGFAGPFCLLLNVEQFLFFLSFFPFLIFFLMHLRIISYSIM